MYGVIHKQTKQFFAGFDSKQNIVWTADKSKAWSGSLQLAKLKSSCLISGDVNAQRKPVAL